MHIAESIRRAMEEQGPRYGEVDVRGDTYRVRSLHPGREFLEFGARLQLERLAHPSRAIRRKLGIKGPWVPIHGWLAATCTVDDEGRRLYAKSDAPSLAKDGLLCEKIASLVMELTGLRETNGTVDFDPAVWLEGQ